MRDGRKPQELLLLLTTYWERMGLTVRALLLSTLSLHARAHHHTLHALSGYCCCCTCACAVMSPIICQSTDTIILGIHTSYQCLDF